MKCFWLLLLLVINSSFAQKEANKDLISRHLKYITKTKVYRNHSNVNQLNTIANYIKEEFSRSSNEVSFQAYEVNGEVFKNVVNFPTFLSQSIKIRPLTL